MSNRSYKIQLLVETGHEHETVIRGYTDKGYAMKVVDSKNAAPLPSLVLGYALRQIDLVIHDGAHALLDDWHKA